MSERRQMFVDGQVLQTTAKDRGMGRYCICLIKAVIDSGEYDVTVLFSSKLPLKGQAEKEAKQIFRGAILRDVDLWTVNDHTIERAAKHNEALLTRLMAEEARDGAIFFIPSLFQEPLVSVFPEGGATKTLLFHDLIPYLYHHRYEPVMKWENYLKRFKYIFEADLIFTNSLTVADDLNMYLGVPRRKLCRIDGAAIHIDHKSEKPEHIDTAKPFILFNTSDDPRKNNLRTVIAFEEFCKVTGKDYNLVLTSRFGKRQREQLQHFSERLLFTGNIHEHQLNWLFDNCRFVLFTPESEGLGLPALEAVDAGKKAVCSSIPVLREISHDAFYFCDHENSYSILRGMIKADDPTSTINKKAYKEIQSYYSWPQTVRRMIRGIENFKPKPMTKRPKIAVLVAAPDGMSGVGLTSLVLHPTLSEYFDIEYYLERGLGVDSVRPNYLRYVAPCYPASSFSAERYAKYDAVFYHIGNGDYHLESITSAFNMPGYVIVHDTTIVEAYRVMQEMGMMSADRVRLEARLDEIQGTKYSSYYTSLVNRQLGVLVHSDYALKAMQEVLDGPVPVVKTGLPIMVPETENLHDRDKLTIGLAGAIADVKGLDVIEAIAADPNFIDCDIKLFGYNHASPEKLAKLDSYDNISVATNVSDFDFQTNFEKLDVFVNFRLIYKGETSNTTLEAMRQGVVAVVRDIGWYGELPDDVVVKVKSPEGVLQVLRQLIKDKKRMHAIGMRAKAFVGANFTGEQYAAAMRRLLEDARKLSSSPNVSKAQNLRRRAR